VGTDRASRGSSLKRHLRRFSEEHGYAGTAIAFPIVLVLTFALFQWGFWYVGQTVAQAAANAAYQQSRSYQATDTDGIQAGNASIATNAGMLRDFTVVITRGPDTVTATVTGTPVVIVPMFPMPQITVTRTGPLERWVSAP
jgi:hypothetical protein